MPAPGRSSAILVSVALTAVSVSTLAATWVVAPWGGDFTTIQAAIDAASAGDEVFVRCGTYFENVTLKDGVHLRGMRAECVTVDAQGSGNVVTIPSGTQPTVVEGLTIRGGNMNAQSNGAGVFVIGPGSPTITRNIIEDNGVQGSGAGILVAGAYTASDTPVISRNVIRGNHNCCRAGGVTLTGTNDALIAGNLIAGNSGYYGGGIYAYIGATIVNNTIIGNTAYYGGAILSWGGSLAIVNNLIEDNFASLSGGGVYTNDISIVTNNLAVDNVPNNWDTPAGDLTGFNNNISAPSRLIDPDLWTFEGVQPNSFSPLLEAGAFPPGPPIDLRGIPRPLDAFGDGAPNWDIGARENEGVTGLRFDPGDVLTWDTGGQFFNLYRGDLDVLRATGDYTQDPAIVPDAQIVCVIASPGQPQAGDPVSGGVFFYLVAVHGFDAEGPLGFASDRSTRLKTTAICLD